MANSYTSPNMLLTIPSPGLDPGPDWANNLNASLTLVDAHDHSPGKGVKITPSGLNISSDLTFNSNNATTLRSLRLVPFPNSGAFNPTAFDVGSLYQISPDLYFIDGAGNNIQITKSGFVNSGAGSISGLGGFPNASASYNGGSGTFIFQQAVNTAANLDVASITLRNATALSNGVTVSPPASIPSSYGITLPSLPLVASLLSMDTSGNITTPIPTALSVYLAGGIQYASTGSNWTSASGSFVNFSAHTISGSTLLGSAVLPATGVPGIKFASLPAGTYAFMGVGQHGGTATGSFAQTFFRFSDGTNVSNYVAISPGINNSSDFRMPLIIGMITYATLQTNITIQAQAQIVSGSCSQVAISNGSDPWEIYAFKIA